MEEVKALVGQQFALSVDIGEGRAIQINGVFMKDDDEGAMNRQLDQLWRVTERMRDRVRVRQLQDEIRADWKKYEQAEAAYQTSFDEAEKFVRIGKIVPDRLKVDAETHIKSMVADEAGIRAKEATLEDLRKRLASNGLEPR